MYWNNFVSSWSPKILVSRQRAFFVSNSRMFLPPPQCNSPGRKLLYLSSGDPPNAQNVPNVPNVEEIKTFQRHNWGLLTQQIDSKFKAEKFNFEEYLIFCVRMFNVFAFARELQKTGVSQQLKIWPGFCGIFPQQIFPITFTARSPLAFSKASF